MIFVSLPFFRVQSSDTFDNNKVIWEIDFDQRRNFSSSKQGQLLSKVTENAFKVLESNVYKNRRARRSSQMINIVKVSILLDHHAVFSFNSQVLGKMLLVYIPNGWPRVILRHSPVHSFSLGGVCSNWRHTKQSRTVIRNSALNDFISMALTRSTKSLKYLKQDYDSVQADNLGPTVINQYIVLILYNMSYLRLICTINFFYCCQLPAAILKNIVSTMFLWL